MKFLINIDCLGTYDAEYIDEKIPKFMIKCFQSKGGCVFSNKFKMAHAQNMDA